MNQVKGIIKAMIPVTLGVAVGMLLYEQIKKATTKTVAGAGAGTGAETETLSSATGTPMGGTCQHPDQEVCKNFCENTLNGTYGNDQKCYRNGVAVGGGIFGGRTLAPKRSAK